ncbi:transcription initiation factor TFIID subunit 11 [Capsaspora owczarzaki ATCC 30864]|uniref:Transcription initiation factor TFIID subunit 11 n=1 Tax=Capsaspora owczarzaki (strain ATCC 30864) TaxID=595528 RepID=A0A0D2WMQ7_CAPO3|nr:transcription initiation factor TFIID subunit 11 [Capsaspora owczarzaki ATCC 30864]KJE91503.1 transcription initiation factor TFIID subunit 11 [Capsaspora owczarzaki ATCC 30864]|eukprot:XP_004349382.1 transcription initiation factor TFIID subunit 11 [Capsaspora owczarzaki ATCC 30864]
MSDDSDYDFATEMSGAAGSGSGTAGSGSGTNAGSGSGGGNSLLAQLRGPTSSRPSPRSSAASSSLRTSTAAVPMFADDDLSGGGAGGGFGFVDESAKYYRHAKNVKSVPPEQRFTMSNFQIEQPGDARAFRAAPPGTATPEGRGSPTPGFGSSSSLSASGSGGGLLMAAASMAAAAGGGGGSSKSGFTNAPGMRPRPGGLMAIVPATPETGGSKRPRHQPQSSGKKPGRGRGGGDDDDDDDEFQVDEELLGGDSSSGNEEEDEDDSDAEFRPKRKKAHQDSDDDEEGSDASEHSDAREDEGEEDDEDDDDPEGAATLRRFRARHRAASAADGGDAAASGEAAKQEEENMENEQAITFAKDDDEIDLESDRDKLKLLVDAFTPEQLHRYECYRRSGFPRAVIRKVMQQQLNSAVSIPSVIVMAGIAKVFVGEIIEQARDVMVERDEGDKIQPAHIREALRRLRSKGVISERDPPKARLFRR